MLPQQGRKKLHPPTILLMLGKGCGVIADKWTHLSRICYSDSILLQLSIGLFCIIDAQVLCLSSCHVNIGQS